MSHFFARWFFRPLLVSAHQQDNMLRVYVVNEHSSLHIEPGPNFWRPFSAHADGERRGLRRVRGVASESFVDETHLWAIFRSVQLLGVRRRHAPRYREREQKNGARLDGVLTVELWSWRVLNPLSSHTTEFAMVP